MNTSPEAGSSKRRPWRERLTRALASGVRDRDQLRDLLKLALERGVLDADAFAMLEGAMGVAEMHVRDVMVPRPEMVCLRRDAPIAQILATVVESGHSRFPVLDGDRDDVAGILLAKDLLRLYLGGKLAAFDMREYLRPALFVPESKRLNVLLQEFRLSRNHIVMVVDEYGGVAGLVTIEDVIEQIVGEIDDEFDVEDEIDIRKESDQVFSVRGSTRIEDFNEFFSTTLPPGEYETVAGLVLRQLGRMPRRGDAVTIGRFQFRVVRVDRRRIEGLRVSLDSV